MSGDFILWDARYAYDPDRALVLSVCSTLKQAKRDAPDYGVGTVVTDPSGDVVYTVPEVGRA